MTPKQVKGLYRWWVAANGWAESAGLGTSIANGSLVAMAGLLTDARIGFSVSRPVSG